MNEILKQAQKQLPKGASKEIAKKANTSSATVCRVFNGQSSPQLENIIKCTAEYMVEYKEKVKKATESLSEAMKMETTPAN